MVASNFISPNIYESENLKFDEVQMLLAVSIYRAHEKENPKIWLPLIIDRITDDLYLVA